MSVAPPIRERVNPRRARPTHKMQKTPWPWHDRSGRLSWLKCVALAAEITPALWVAFALSTHRLGARPLTEATHQTGLWALRFLLLSLVASPMRAIFNWHRLVLVRRQLGLAALFYALAHLGFYSADQGWNLVTVSSEVLRRFYLELGLVALVGLAVLGVTSTDTLLRQLGHWWKRLHRIVYGVAVLAILHYFIQSKADVSEATLMAGLFVWMMAWRVVPSGADRAPLPMVMLGFFAAAMTAGIEYAWYGIATRINPMRALTAETDIAYGPHPAGQVLLVCLSLAIATALFWAQHRQRLRGTLAFDIALYAGGALIVCAIVFAFNLTDDWLPEDWTFWQAAACFVAGGIFLGALRRALPRQQRVLDTVCVVLLMLPLAAGLAI